MRGELLQRYHHGRDERCSQAGLRSSQIELSTSTRGVIAQYTRSISDVDAIAKPLIRTTLAHDRRVRSDLRTG